MLLLLPIVEKYLALAGGYGVAAPLAAFALGREETERVFSLLDEDYHISRFFHFSDTDGERFFINGFAHTHVSIDPEIQTIL